MNRLRSIQLLCRAALAAGLGLVIAGTAASDPAPEDLLSSRGCPACHRFQAEAPSANLIGPDLHYAGDKYQAPWLIRFLQKPVVVRKGGHPNDPGFLKGQPEFQPPHPALSAAEAKTIGGYLATLRLPDLPTVAIDPEPLSRVARVKTKMLFERDLSCIACHESVNLAGMPRGGISGPSLLDAGNRLQAAWVALWLREPERFVQKSRMPVFQLEPQVLSDLTRYIMSHKQSTEGK